MSTFAFGVAAQRISTAVRCSGRQLDLGAAPRHLFGLDLSSQRTYYYVVLAVLAVTLVVVARLRRSGIGRTTIAVRDNQDTAAGYSVAPARVKLRAFALAGGIAALGGAFLGALVTNVPLTDRFFTVESSLQLVSLAVIGGLGSVAGPVLGSLWVIGLPAFFPDNELVPLFTSSVGSSSSFCTSRAGSCRSRTRRARFWAGRRSAWVRLRRRRSHDTPPASVCARPDLRSPVRPWWPRR